MGTRIPFMCVVSSLGGGDDDLIVLGRLSTREAQRGHVARSMMHVRWASWPTIRYSR